jgi:hypothetical protein
MTFFSEKMQNVAVAMAVAVAVAGGGGGIQSGSGWVAVAGWQWYGCVWLVVTNSLVVE